MLKGVRSMRLKRLLLAGVMAICGMAGILAIPVQDALAVTCPKGSKHTEADNIAGCNIENTGDQAAGAVSNRVNTAINVVLGMIGVVAVIMIIIGGIQFVTSQGDAAKAARARNTILYSIVGLIVALLAFAIVNFVLTSVFK